MAFQIYIHLIMIRPGWSFILSISYKHDPISSFDYYVRLQRKTSIGIKTFRVRVAFGYNEPFALVGGLNNTSKILFKYISRIDEQCVARHLVVVA